MEKVGFQGEHGAYSEQAIFEYFGEKVESVPCRSFEDVFLSLENEETDFGVVPIENFLAGSVVQTYDLLLKYNFYIIGQILLPIHHNLIGNKNAKFEGIKEVYSHPQALAQCRDFLEKNNLSSKEYYDTAGSVKFLKESGDLDKAGIASEIAGKIYDMKILKKGIESVKNNTTRFVIISKKEFSEKYNSDKKYLSSIIFVASNIPAALYKCLGGFATNGVNLLKIESRPMKGEIGNYFFYIDVEGHKSEERIQNSLKELEFFSSSVKLLGSYLRQQNIFNL